MDNMQNMGGANKCRCAHHKVIPVLVVLLGLTFLLQALDVVDAKFVMIAWPILLIAGGLMKLADKSGMCKCC